jgi:tetratricopeptide (TPR) repeat protein
MNEINEYEIAGSVRDLIDRSFSLPTGDEKIMTLEEAVRIADRGADLKLQYEAREELIEAAFWGGETEKALVAYSWCLAQFDKNPGSFPEWTLLWRYKWIINVIFHFPQIPKEQIYEMLDEMERRYRAAGYGLRVVNYYRYRIERFFGNRDEALKHFRYAQTLARDTLSDCEACEIDERASFQIYCEQDELALRIAEPVLEGYKRCRTVPHRTLAHVLLPLVRLGRWDEAWDYHHRGYTLISNDPNFLEYLSDHLIFLALYGEFEKATHVLEKHFHWAKKNTDKYDRYLFFRAAWLFLDILKDAGEETLKLRLPESFPLYEESGEYEIERLKEWFLKSARDIAGQFDKRNGTARFARELDETPALKSLKRR